MQRDLVKRAVGGDHGAFAQLASASIDRLYSAARLILRDDAAAEDAAQEALVSAWRHLPELRDPDRFEAWLHRLLVRACYREAGRTKRRMSVEVRALETAPGVPDGALDVALRDQLERGFRRLDTDQRAVLVLHYFLGYSLDEAAALLGLPAGTVRSRLHRATRAMRAALDADSRPGLANEGGLA